MQSGVICTGAASVPCVGFARIHLPVHGRRGEPSSPHSALRIRENAALYTRYRGNLTSIKDSLQMHSARVDVAPYCCLSSALSTLAALGEMDEARRLSTGVW